MNNLELYKIYYNSEEAKLSSKNNAIELVEILQYNGDNQYIVKTKDKIVCSATYNWLDAYYYADDRYGIIEIEDEYEYKDEYKK
jgi:hypothetical protein